MKTKFPLTGMEPRQAICMAIILSLCVYFTADVSLLISKLDYTTENLGTSESSDFFVFYAGARFLLDGAPLTSLYDPAALKSYQISLGAEAGFVHPFTYPPSYALLIEDKGSGMSLIQDLKREGIRAIPVKPTTDKVIRMNAHTARIEAGCVHLPRHAAWLDEFRRELMLFPAGKHDDQVDALSQGLDRAFNYRKRATTGTVVGLY